jgi:hypothetical protein
MEMQDKEFDDLFRSKLDGFEVKPSAKAWDNIAVEMNAGKQRKMLLPFLSIAASIIVLVTAGILFIPQKQIVPGKHLVKNKTGKITQPAETISVAKNNPQPGLLASNNPAKLIKAATMVNSIALVHPAKEAKYMPVKNAIATDTVKAVKTDVKPELAAIPDKKQDEIKGTVPDDNTQLNIKEPVKENAAITAKPELTAAQLPVSAQLNAAPAKTKHRIKSFGDLVNVVVAKVDKRKDKIIEFTDTDGDESTITGINLGFVSIKKEDK